MWTRAISPSFLGQTPDLVSWRRDQMIRAGFDGATASAFSRTAVDLHALIELVERGCPPHLGARIMAPLDLEPPTR